MKTWVRKFFVCLWLTVLSHTFFAGAQTFTTLHDFNGLDGGLPESGLTLSGDTLYGATPYGSVIFKMQTDGTGFTNLHVFSRSINGTNSDGNEPFGNLALSGDVLYGTTHSGGLGGVGTVFAIKTDGSGFTNLHSFAATSRSSGYTNSDGAFLYAEPIVSGNRIYATANSGGDFGTGTVFAMNSDGSGFTTLHSFGALPAPYSGTNDDGAYPIGGVIITNNLLYGTTGVGGKFGNGSIFVLNTDGSGFTNLYNFTVADGTGPQDSLLLSDDTLFGTTFGGGNSGSGTVFSVKTDGSEFKVLYSFSATSSPRYTNSDGSWPYDKLILAGHTLYGTASSGGSLEGTVFAVNTDGTGFTVVHDFTGGSDGDTPIGSLVLSGNKLYGMAQYDGGLGNGTVFSIAFTPQLSVARTETNVTLSWPTNVAGFDYTDFSLQCATNLVSPDWTSISSNAGPFDGRVGVTVPISGAQKFYRLGR